MRISLSIVLFIISSFACLSQKTKTASAYFPPPGQWQQRTPAEMGLDPAAIDSAVAFAISHESKNPRQLETDQANTFGKEPFGNIIGPMADRGEPTGIIVYKGYIIKTWGEPLRCDMTHSVTKSFLSTVVGLAVDSGLIRNVQDTVAGYIPPVELYGQADEKGKPFFIYPFASPHNRTITWNDMARFGLLTMHQGNWKGKQLISKQWVKQALTPTSVKTDYGYMNWFLNTDRKMLPSTPATAFMHIGNGANLIYVDPEHELVVVVRWINQRAMDGVIKALLGGK